ncbi:AAA family ATPase [Alkalinema pantanalense CENA528]|uniref:AAA family ATPase n=1 Tax=Alkalinema pantanalense TaxID=1620705 RepID=UPI003D6E499A
MTAILTEFTLTNFKSYHQAHLPLGPLTLLIGANASGKSNAIEALKIIHWMAATTRLPHHHDRISQELVSLDVRGNEASFFYNQTHAPCILSCSFNNNPNHQYIVQIEQDNHDFGIVYEYATTAQFDTSPLSLQILKNLLFIDAIPSAMREYSVKGKKHLTNNGSNLSSVLYHLCQTPSHQQTLLDFIQSLPEQAIRSIGFIETPRNEVMLTLTETFGHQERDYDITLLSDGTLRVLAIATALLSAPEGSLIVIEEIDNGIHPSRAQHLLTKIREIADRRHLRVLLSTHNPALMDALPDEALSDVVFCYRDPENGDSRLTRLGDIDNFPALVSQGSLGHLVTAGIVDRFIKHPTTPEERKQKALEWIQALEESA